LTLSDITDSVILIALDHKLYYIKI